MHPLNSLLVRFSHRLRLMDGWRLAQRTFWLASLAACLVNTVGRFYLIERLWIWVVSSFLLWAISVIGYASFKPMSLNTTARRMDAQLGLQERLSTALFLQDQSAQSASILQAFPSSLKQAQQQDALTTARSIRINSDLRLQWLPRPMGLAGVLLLLTIVMSILPNPMDAILAERAAIKEAAQEQAAQIEKLRNEIAATEELSPEQRQELLEKLDELSKALQANSGDIEQALADLSKVEKALHDRMTPDDVAQLRNLQSLAAQLQALSGKENDPQREDIDEAIDGLNALTEQLDSLSQDQRDEISKALAQMSAQASQSGNAELAQALSSLAQAFQKGDEEVAAQAAQNAREALEQAKTELADQAAIGQAIAQLQAGRDALSLASHQLSQGQQPTPGQGNVPGVGAIPVSGQGQPIGGGTKATSLPPATGRGKANPPQGSAPDALVGDLEGQIYAPWQPSPRTGEQLYIPGQNSGQGESQAQEGQGNLPGTSNPALVPYSQVFFTYLNAANQALQQSTIPSDLQDFIRLYFSQLEP